MSFIRNPRGNSYQVIFRESLVAETFGKRELTFSFPSLELAEAYKATSDAWLAQGKVPPEWFGDKARREVMLGEIISSYMVAKSISEGDQHQLRNLLGEFRTHPLAKCDSQWAETWVASMKHEKGLSPSTIRHYVGALARCLDWARKQHRQVLPANPLRELGRGYSTYNEHDRRKAKENGHEGREDVERDRRLEDGEEPRIRNILAGEKPEERQRPLELHYQGALEFLFDLALESAMRMREMYTLDLYQVDVKRRTIYLGKTKNGDKRQVPMTTVAVAAFEKYMEQVKNGERGMEGFTVKSPTDRLFPWWDGDLSPEALRRVTSKLSRQYRRVFEAAKAPGLHFHDLRHEATSRFFERTTMKAEKIQKITGHKTHTMLMRYTNLRGSDLADELW